jgi:hypothetical protein
MMLIKSGPEADDPRRRLLIKALTASLYAALMPAGVANAQNIFGSRPSKLPPNQSIYRLVGSARVNDQDASIQTQIRSGDTVETGRDSELVFVVGGNAMILRGQSRIVIDGPPRTSEGAALIVNTLRVLTGKILMVTGRKSPMSRVDTSVATIGIRGTGFYVESEPQQTYFCTCYGVTDVASTADPTSTETITAKHHDRPVYIVTDGGPGRNIRNAPFINHTDQELQLIETLVGRTPPFIFPKDDYTGPRREY